MSLSVSYTFEGSDGGGGGCFVPFRLQRDEEGNMATVYILPSAITSQEAKLTLFNTAVEFISFFTAHIY